MRFVGNRGGSCRSLLQVKVPIRAPAGSATAGNRGPIGVKDRHPVAVATHPEGVTALGSSRASLWGLRARMGVPSLHSSPRPASSPTPTACSRYRLVPMVSKPRRRSRRAYRGYADRRILITITGELSVKFCQFGLPSFLDSEKVGDPGPSARPRSRQA